MLTRRKLALLGDGRLEPRLAVGQHHRERRPGQPGRLPRGRRRGQIRPEKGGVTVSSGHTFTPASSHHARDGHGPPLAFIDLASAFRSADSAASRFSVA